MYKIDRGGKNKMKNLSIRKKVAEENDPYYNEIHDLNWGFANRFDASLFDIVQRLESAIEQETLDDLKSLQGQRYYGKQLASIKEKLQINIDWLEKMKNYDFQKYISTVSNKIEEMELLLSQATVGKEGRLAKVGIEKKSTFELVEDIMNW